MLRLFSNSESKQITPVTRVACRIRSLPLSNRTRLFSAKAPHGSSVTSFADREVIIAKCAFAVMTCHAAQSSTGRMVVQRLRCRDLPSLRHAGAHLMTIVAVSLWIVLGVTEANPERRHVLRSTRVTTQLMASAT
jgi:hypothetical protein